MKEEGWGFASSTEAKEKIEIQAENQTLASITYQNYFKLYKKFQVAQGQRQLKRKIFEIYNLPVVIIPTNNPMIVRIIMTKSLELWKKKISQ